MAMVEFERGFGPSAPSAAGNADYGRGAVGGMARGIGERGRELRLPMPGAMLPGQIMPQVSNTAGELPIITNPNPLQGPTATSPSNPQADIMRMIMMQILAPQLQGLFGGGGMGASGGGGWGPVAGSQNGLIPSGLPGAQGPQGMMQGPMAWLAPFIFQRFFQNFGGGMGQNFGGQSGAGSPSPQMGLPMLARSNLPVPAGMMGTF